MRSKSMALTSADEERVNIFSRGEPVDGFSAEHVRDNLEKQFKLSPERAQAMLREGTVLKKSADVATAKKFVVLFKRLGLQVQCISVNGRAVEASSGEKPRSARPPKAAHIAEKPVDNRAAVSDASADNSDASIEQEWRRRLGSSVSQAPGNPGHIILLSLVAFVNVLPSFFHVATIAAIFWLLVDWGLTVVSVIAGDSSVGLVWLILVPILLIVIVLIFLKPLLPRAWAEKEQIISEQDAPDLYALIRVLCELTGAPFPTEITASNRMNILLLPLSGVTGLRNQKLSLSIGMPLVGVMTKQQFVATLAHELGHYSKPTPMQAYILINFFQRSLEEKASIEDILDIFVREKMKENRMPFAVTWLWEKITVLSCGVMRVLFLMSRAMSRPVCNWMELEADYCAAYIAGGECFNSLSTEQGVGLVTHRYISDMNEKAWTHNQLLRNIADAVARQREQWSQEELAAMLAQPREFDDSIWQLEPISQARIEHAEALGFAGTYHDDSPASDIFFDFTTVCESITFNGYKIQYPGERLKQHIVDNDQILALNKSLNSAEQALKVYLGSTYTGRLIEFDEPMEAYLLRMDHQQTIDWIRNNLMEYRRNQKLADKLLGSIGDAKAVLSLSEAGIEVSFKGSSIDKKNLNEVQESILKEETELDLCREKLYSVDHMFFRRIMMAVESMAGELKLLSQRHLAVVQGAGDLADELRELEECSAVLLVCIEQNEKDISKVSKKIEDLSGQGMGLISDILSEAFSIRISNERGGGQSLRELILHSMKVDAAEVSGLSPAAVVESALKVQQTIIHHYGHALGQLAELCHQAESQQNLKPLKLFAKERA